MKTLKYRFNIYSSNPACLKLGDTLLILTGSQNGFIKGRYIGESILPVINCMEDAKSKDKTGLLLQIDFAKAFDKAFSNVNYKHYLC